MSSHNHHVLNEIESEILNYNSHAFALQLSARLLLNDMQKSTIGLSAESIRRAALYLKRLDALLFDFQKEAKNLLVTSAWHCANEQEQAPPPPVHLDILENEDMKKGLEKGDLASQNRAFLSSNMLLSNASGLK